MAKLPETRKEELLAAAETLFREKSVDKISVSDIVKAAKVSQGTFYNYYESKEDIFIGILNRICEDILERCYKISKDTGLNAIQKLNFVALEEFQINRNNDDLFEMLHKKQFMGTHQKYIVNRIEILIPLYSDIICQGIEEGSFNTKYPKQAARYILTATKFMFDPGIFSYDVEAMEEMVVSTLDFNERILGAEQGSLQDKKFLSQFRKA